MPEQVIIELAPTEAGSSGGQTLTLNTSVTAFQANASRECFIVTADTADVWVSYGAAAAVVGHGVRVKAGGPPWREESWKGAVTIISSGAAVVGLTELDLSVGDDQGQQPTGADAFQAIGPSDTPIPPPTAPPPGTPYPPNA